MTDGIKAGDFAKLCGTTKNTLIHYDQMGILKPAAVGENGYRYYRSNDQYLFMTIRALTDAGFSLREVAGIFATYDPDALGRSIAEHRKELKERIARLKTASLLLDEMERQVNEDVELGSGEFRLVERPRRLVLPLDFPVHAMFLTDPEAAQVESRATAVLAEISPEATLARYGMKAYGDPAAEGVRYDGGFYLLPPDAKAPQGVQLEEIPAGVYAELAGRGDEAAAALAHEQLLAFVAEQGMKPVDPRYEMLPLRLSNVAPGDEYRFVVSVRCV